MKTSRSLHGLLGSFDFLRGRHGSFFWFFFCFFFCFFWFFQSFWFFFWSSFWSFFQSFFRPFFRRSFGPSLGPSYNPSFQSLSFNSSLGCFPHRPFRAFRIGLSVHLFSGAFRIGLSAPPPLTALRSLPSALFPPLTFDVTLCQVGRNSHSCPAR